MSKYRIKLHSDGCYTIQKRFLFIFWNELRSYSGDCSYIRRWSQPPTEVMKLYEKYGH